MPDAKLVERILSALEDGVPPEVAAILRVVPATDVEVEEALAALAQYEHRVRIERAEPSGCAKDVLAPGSRLGDFVIEDVLGSGAMGTVYRARQASLDRPVALKVLPRDLGALDRRFRARFRREATLAATIRHPHVAEV